MQNISSLRAEFSAYAPILGLREKQEGTWLNSQLLYTLFKRLLEA